MERKLIALACTMAALATTVIIHWFMILSASPTRTTISEIASNPEAWVNKKVRVNGTIIGPLIYIPEEIPPYNYVLKDKDNRTMDIGVRYSEEVPEANAYVTVIGFVKAGRTEGLMGGDLVYYIEAERIVIL